MKNNELYESYGDHENTDYVNETDQASNYEDTNAIYDNNELYEYYDDGENSDYSETDYSVEDTENTEENTTSIEQEDNLPIGITPRNPNSFQNTRRTITFNPNGGSVSPTSINRNLGETLGTLPTPNRTGFTTAGWWTEPNGGNQVTSNTPVVANQTCFARWNINITFNSNGGSSVGTRNIISGAIGSLPTTTRANLNFDGWWTASTGGFRIGSGTTTNNHVTYFARWYAVISLNPNGGTVNPNRSTVLAGANVGNLPTPSRTHYNFTGWFTALNGGNQITNTTPANTNMSLFARWTPIVRVVTFNPNGGTVNPTTRNVNSGQPVGNLPTPTRAGHTSAGWWTAASNNSTRITDSTVVSANTTYFARWNLTVTFNSNGGSTVANRNTVSGTPLGSLPTVTRSNFTFAGWWTAQNGGTQVTTNTAPNGNVTYYARWQATVTFNPNGGTAINPNTRNILESTAFGNNMPTTTRTHYNFAGWWTAQSGGDQIGATNIITRSMQLFARWTPIVRIVILNPNGGTINPNTVEVNSGRAVGTLPTPTRAGHSFAGWWTAASGNNAIRIDSNRIITANITFFARWNVTVTFNSNDGGASTTRTIISGTLLGSLPEPTRPNFFFGGWWTGTGNNSTRITENTVINSNITYYARWNVTVTFNPNGGTAINLDRRTVVENGTLGNNIPTTSRTNFNFAGWFTAPNGGTQVFANTPIARNIELFARWTEIIRTVTLNPNGGTINPNTVPVASGQPVGNLPTPNRAGHSFAGWWTATGNNSTRIEPNRIITANITLFARWNITVTFNSNGGSTVPNRTLISGSTLGELPHITRGDFVFGGWWNSPTGGTQINHNTVLTANITLFARWHAVVSFNPNGGNAVNPATRNVLVGTEIGNLPNTSRSGHTFQGWWTGQTGGTQVFRDTIINSGIALFARWNQNITVTFDANGGTPATQQRTVQNGQSLGNLFPANPIRSGHTFGGWFIQPSLITQMLASTIITGNITAVPNWRTNNPVIIRPADNQVFEVENISVSWHAIIGVNYFITLFDMTGDVFSVETVIART